MFNSFGPSLAKPITFRFSQCKTHKRKRGGLISFCKTATTLKVHQDLLLPHQDLLCRIRLRDESCMWAEHLTYGTGRGGIYGIYKAKGNHAHLLLKVNVLIAPESGMAEDGCNDCRACACNASRVYARLIGVRGLPAGLGETTRLDDMCSCEVRAHHQVCRCSVDRKSVV